MPIDLPPVHHHLDFFSPLSGQRADEFVSFLVGHTSGTVVDVGSGWAELSLRVLEASPDVSGIAIDQDSDAIKHGQALAIERNLSSRIQLLEGDVRDLVPDSAQGAICIGASHVWAESTAIDQPLDYKTAFLKLSELVGPGSPVVFGDAIWSCEPTEEAIAVLSGRHDEFLFLSEVVDLAEECGFVAVQTHEANLDEWDHFESGFTAGYAEWLAEHGPDHADYAEKYSRMKQQRHAYLKGYRGVMGMVYLCLLAV